MLMTTLVERSEAGRAIMVGSYVNPRCRSSSAHRLPTGIFFCIFKFTAKGSSSSRSVT